MPGTTDPVLLSKEERLFNVVGQSLAAHLMCEKCTKACLYSHSNWYQATLEDIRRIINETEQEADDATNNRETQPADCGVAGK